MLDVIVELAWARHGALTVTEAQAHGVSRSWLSRAAARGVLRRRAHGVYVLAAAPRTARQDAVVHVLAAGAGALVTADTALALWCPELSFPARPIVAVPLDCGYRTTGAVIRRSRDLAAANAGTVDGVPVVGVARALLDAAVGRSPEELLRLVDACRRSPGVPIGALVQALEVHARRGRPGVATYRAALRLLTHEVPDSELERLVVRDLVAAGVPAPRLHHLVRLPDQRPIELDLDWPRLLLDVELDGRDHAARALTMRRDRQRDRLLQAAGYIVARYTWDDYVSDRPAMVAEIAALHRAARRAA